MATETKPSGVKVKASDGPSSSRGKMDSSVKDRKKIESSSNKQNFSDSKARSSVSTKIEVKPKTTPSSASKPATTTTTTTTKTVTVKKEKAKREKKVYSLAGQKHDPPEEREPLRIFYESLSRQIPGSEMAEFWMMEHGMLSPERARRAYEKKQRKQKQLRMGTPIKSPPPSSSKPGPSRRPEPKPVDTKTKKKLIKEDDDSEDDFVLSHKRRKG